VFEKFVDRHMKYRPNRIISSDTFQIDIGNDRTYIILVNQYFQY